MFKIPKEEDIEAVLKEYEILRENAVKVSDLASFTNYDVLVHIVFGLLHYLVSPKSDPFHRTARSISSPT